MSHDPSVTLYVTLHTEAAAELEHTSKHLRGLLKTSKTGNTNTPRSMLSSPTDMYSLPKVIPVKLHDSKQNNTAMMFCKPVYLNNKRHQMWHSRFRQRYRYVNAGISCGGY